MKPLNRTRKLIVARRSTASARRRLLVEHLETRKLLAVLAGDDFESANFNGGSGWMGASWQVAGDATVLSSNVPHAGQYQARLRTGSGDLIRAVDVSGQTDLRLQFWSKVSSFESSDKAYVQVSSNGTSWTTVQHFGSAQSDNQYHFYDIAVVNPSNTLYVRFDAGMSATSDQWYLDDIAVTGVPSTPQISISDATANEGDDSFRYLKQFNAAGGEYLDGPHGMTKGPDGALYVANQFGNTVYRYDAATGAPLPAPGKTGAEFVTATDNGGLNGARMLAFGPGNDLYVVSEHSHEVLRYNGTTGAYVSTLIASGSGGLNHPKGLLFHGDYLYVGGLRDGDVGLDAILRFDALTGVPAGLSEIPGDAVFIADGDHDLDNPGQIIFHNGFFYVASTAPGTKNAILKYTTDGDYVEDFVTSGSGGLFGPTDMEFSSDDKYLYVVSWANDQVIQFDATTGAFVDVVADGAGLDVPVDIILEANGTFIVTSRATNQIRRYGPNSLAAFTVSLSAASNSDVAVDYATAELVPSSAVGGVDYVTASGTINFAPGQTSRTVFVPTRDDLILESNETFYVHLTNPLGLATIVDAQGIGTIVDNEVAATKFYVVNDASTNHTYEYDAAGASIENYALDSGTDKVYAYANGRANKSGSQSASTVFALAAGNTNPQGIADPPPVSSGSIPTHRIASAVDDEYDTIPVAWSGSIHDFAPLPARNREHLTSQAASRLQGVDRFMRRLGRDLVPAMKLSSVSEMYTVFERPIAQARNIDAEADRGAFEEALELLAVDLLKAQS